MQRGRDLLAVLTLIAVVACGGGGGGAGTKSSSFEIPTTGGSIDVAGTSVTVFAPPGSVAATTNVDVSTGIDANPRPPTAFLVEGAAVGFSATTFTTPVSVRFDLDKLGFPTEEQPFAKVFKRTTPSDPWVEQATVYDPVLHAVGIQTNSFSQFTVGFPYPAGSSYQWLKTLAGPGTALGQVNQPTDVGVDLLGRIYVTDTGNNRVQRFERTGTSAVLIAGPGTTAGKVSAPTGLGLDSGGNLFVADTGNNRVNYYLGSGDFKSTIGGPGSAQGQFNQPKDVAVDAAGDIYVTDPGNHRVQKFNVQFGNTGFVFSSIIGSTGSGPGQFDAPNGVVYAKNCLFVADSASAYVSKFAVPTNTFVSRSGGPGTAQGQFNSPVGLAVDPSGALLVADAANNRVQQLDATGAFQVFVSSAGTGDGMTNTPKGVCVDRYGFVYVADTANNRIQKFRLVP